MSIEDRLHALAQQYAAQHGSTALADQSRMVSLLSSQAPDLHGEIKALGAAIAGNTAGRVAGAGNADLEAQAIAGEIAGAQKLSMASVVPAVAVARRLGVASSSAPAAGIRGGNDSGWAGDSVIAGAAPPPPYSPPIAPSSAPQTPGIAPPPVPPAKPIWQNKWAIGGSAAVALLLSYQQLNKQPGPGPGPGPSIPVNPINPNFPPNAPTNPNAPVDPNTPITPNNPVDPNQSSPSNPATGGGQLPALAAPDAQQPTLMLQGQGQSFVVGFSLNGVPGFVSPPQGGWDNGEGTLMLARNPQSSQPDSIGRGRFQKLNSGVNPVRVMQVQWQKDMVGVGPVCVAFIGNGGQDVNPQGSRMCLMDGACNRPIGCGQLPAGQGGGGPGGGGPANPQGRQLDDR